MVYLANGKSLQAVQNPCLPDEDSCIYEKNDSYTFTEVTQQSKARHKDDFLVAFSPVIAEATALAYKGAPAEIQNKLRRVIDVWKDRFIFEPPVQQAIERGIDGKYFPHIRQQHILMMLQNSTRLAEPPRQTSLVPELAVVVLPFPQSSLRSSPPIPMYRSLTCLLRRL